jgi:hypothetical protein
MARRTLPDFNTHFAPTARAQSMAMMVPCTSTNMLATLASTAAVDLGYASALDSGNIPATAFLEPVPVLNPARWANTDSLRLVLGLTFT